MTRLAPVLLETVRVRQGLAPLWYLHLRRLSASCLALGVPFPPALEVPAGGPDRVHRLAVGRSGLEVTTREVGPVGPLALVTSSVLHEPYPHKLAERSVFEAAAGEARRSGADDAVLLSRTGLVAEATIWCLFWWEGDRVAAPPLSLGVLPGVSRLRIEELAGPMVERAVPGRRARALQLFAANAVRGVAPVATLDGVPVPGSRGTAMLAERFWA
jgi:branched-subunit amino acid aminotransferase/4-amino-4-deoxychorismate lyase